jgi:hypothetical protein
MPANSTLRIVRHGGFADLLRSYKNFANGSQVGTIARKSAVDIEVPSGPLTVETRVDWGRCRPLRIEAPPGQTIEIDVANHWGAWLSLWAITFGAGSYLTLSQLPTKVQGSPPAPAS